MADKYYVVLKGRNPGIYTSSREFIRQTQGFSGFKGRRFNSRAEAEAWYWKEKRKLDKKQAAKRRLDSHSFAYSDTYHSKAFVTPQTPPPVQTQPLFPFADGFEYLKQLQRELQSLKMEEDAYRNQMQHLQSAGDTIEHANGILFPKALYHSPLLEGSVSEPDTSDGESDTVKIQEEPASEPVSVSEKTMSELEAEKMQEHTVTIPEKEMEVVIEEGEGIEKFQEQSQEEDRLELETEETEYNEAESVPESASESTTESFEDTEACGRTVVESEMSIETEIKESEEEEPEEETPETMAETGQEQMPEQVSEWSVAWMMQARAMIEKQEQMLEKATEQIIQQSALLKYAFKKMDQQYQVLQQVSNELKQQTMQRDRGEKAEPVCKLPNGIEADMRNQILHHELVCFVDGSYNPATEEIAYGCVSYHRGKESRYYSGFQDPELAEIRNIGGELMGARKALELAERMDVSSVLIFYDYEGIEKWTTGEFKVKNYWTQKYVEEYQRLTRDGVKVTYYKLESHSGNKQHNLADKLARQALRLD